MEAEKINLQKKYHGVADSPKYLVTLYPKELDSIYPSSAEINWPKNCVLCLAPVTHFRQISGRIVTEPPLVVRTVEMEVPYCSDCYGKLKRIFRREKEGVEVIPPHAIHGLAFKFRNPEYAKLFKQANIKITRK